MINHENIFYEVDDFIKLNNQIFLKEKNEKNIKNAGAKSRLALSEVVTIIIAFHNSRMRTFKDYYLKTVCVFMKNDFPNLVSYNRFLELMKTAAFALHAFLQCTRLGKLTGLYFGDSTKLSVCNNRRIYSHKVFKGIAERGKTSTGWFYGFKLHLIVNEYGDLVAFDITPGNIDDRNIKVMKKLTKNLSGKLFADRGYISKSLFDFLFSQGLRLFTKARKNMKTSILELNDKLMLRKRGIIESINNLLKAACMIEHTRHRNPINYFCNLISGLIAYTYFEKKPSIFSSKTLKINGF